MGVTLTSPRPSHGSLNWDAALENDLAALASGINTASVIDGTDANAISKSGVYIGNTLGHSPDGSSNAFYIWANVLNTGGQAQIAIGLVDGTTWTRKQQSSVWSPWIPFGGDTGWVTSGTGIAAGSGWSIAGQRYRIRSGVVAIGLILTKTGSASATANAAGIVPQITGAATLPANLQPSSANGNISTAGTQSTISASGLINGANFTITNLAPSQSVPVGGVLDLMGTYLL